MQPIAKLRPPPIDVITIQSQVIYGSVGNGIAYRTLLKKNLQVLQVPTVLFGCPPYYGPPHGGVVPNEWFSGFLDDLIAREVIHQARAIIIGYLGNDTQCHILERWIQQVIAINPEIKIYIDPVMGDYGEGVYVNQNLVDCYRSPFLNLAHGLTPNGFELEQLCGTPLTTLEQTRQAAAELLKGNTQWVLVTSAPGVANQADEVGLLLVTANETQQFTHSKIHAAVKGTGDMFTAVLISHLLQGESLSEAVPTASNEVCTVLEDAARYGWQEIGHLQALK